MLANIPDGKVPVLENEQVLPFNMGCPAQVITFPEKEKIELYTGIIANKLAYVVRLTASPLHNNHPSNGVKETCCIIVPGGITVFEIL